ncbi:MAG: hypothetical protein R2853_17160 [Thermomicrobiales bacterium]
MAIVAPLPIDTRFYAAILQSGMSARRILSRSTPWDCDPLNPAITPQPAAPISGAVPEGPESAPGAPTTEGDAAPDDASDLSGEIASDSATPGAVLAVESSDWWSASDSPYSSADVEPVAPLTPPVADADASPGGAGAETDASGPADPEAELLAASDASTAPLA